LKKDWGFWVLNHCSKNKFFSGESLEALKKIGSKKYQRPEEKKFFDTQI
jgi:hypothetical protein